ncbi:MarR family winged helix-turn-helix transcriptional regulator [Asticcacaulis solisilvae]|uniref:MarR family winged helix-turn-helix transcriptional regulator n=1 Tax=Asticcacaulis solisilvae TaxID=1217274 RepID=UPI003FD6FD82
MTPEERFSRALHSTARQWRVALDARLKDLGVSQAGWMTIAMVAKADKPPSQGELATQLSVEPATMVAMIDRLVKAGLVERVACTTDRRIKHIHLTAAGEAISDEVHTTAETFRMDILHGISPDKLDQFSELLEQIQKRIETSS